MLNRLEGKVIAIAGGAGGIGSGISARLGEEGAIVIVGDINMQGAEEVAGKIEAAGGKAIPIKVDISDEDSVKAYVDAALKVNGSLNGFHANALDNSIMHRDIDPVEIDMDDYDYMVSKNMRGYFLCTRHAIPALIASGGGCMLYTSSTASYLGHDRTPVYSMCKSAINALARYVSGKYGKQGVRGNVVAPGVIVHPLTIETLGADFIAEFEKNTLLTTRAGRPSDIAAVAAMLLSEDGEYIQGQVIVVDGGTVRRP